MTSERKFLWATWFGRICLLFGTLGNLFAVYVSTFVEPDMIQSCVCAATALLISTIFFSSFPQLRMHYRVHELRKELSERPDFNATLAAKTPTKNGAGHFITLMITGVVTIAFIFFNFVLARIAYLRGSNLELFFHIVVVVVAILMFNSILLIFQVDETFKKIEGLISQCRKDRASSSGQVAD